jgi:hypothetical protein
MGAVQAQDYAGAKWALSQRAGNASDATIEKELEAGRILRTHVLRPTWHFVSPGDIRWMLALTAPRVAARMASYNKQLELTPAVFRSSNHAIAAALEGRNYLTRGELGTVLQGQRIGRISTQRLAHIVMQAELDAVVCSGPRRGKQVTYALLDERVPAAEPLQRDEALGRLALRYFATRSPATTHDFAWWSGLTVKDARRGAQICSPGLAQITVGDKQYWYAARSAPAPSELRTAQLLPNYDEYFIGFKDRSAIGARIRSLELVTGGTALIAHIVCLDGQIAGGWRLRNVKGKYELDFNLLVTPGAAESKRIRAEVARLGRFLQTADILVRDDGGEPRAVAASS